MKNVKCEVLTDLMSNSETQFITSTFINFDDLNVT